MIGIVNYGKGAGNINAICQCYKILGIPFKVINKPSDSNSIGHFVLPGVGHYKSTISELSASGLLDFLLEEIQVKKRFLLGICVGMQLLSDYGEEGDCNGLSIISGKVQKLETGTSELRLPHMGWNSINFNRDEFGLFHEIDPLIGFYFLHGYAFYPKDDSSILASTFYGQEVPCVVSNRNNVFGVQFHPEKSHENGLKLLSNYARIR